MKKSETSMSRTNDDVAGDLSHIGNITFKESVIHDEDKGAGIDEKSESPLKVLNSSLKEGCKFGGNTKNNVTFF